MQWHRRSKAVSITAAIILALATKCASPPAAMAKASNEQQWIVESITKDIAEIILFTASKQAENKIDLDTVKITTSDENPTMVDTEIHWGTSGESIKGTIALNKYIWNPDNYSPWALQLMTRLKLQANDSPDNSSEVISKLSNYSSEVIASENKKITAALTATPLDANLQEQAALICSVLALRETAACFNDLRPELDRICCHLAIAQALRGSNELGNAGKLAEITMNALGGRQADALETIKIMESKSPDDTLASWLRALRMRITHDFRIGESGKGALIEKYEYARALTTCRGTDALSAFIAAKVTPAKIGEPTDWLRLGISQITSVGAGHTYAEAGVYSEPAAFVADYALYHPGAARPNPIEELNKQPTNCLVKGDSWELQPISWSDLAAFHCRHILNAVFEKHHFEQNMWGVPEQAEETLALANKGFSQVQLYPLCQVDMTADVWNKVTKKHNHADLELTNKLVDLITEHPSIVNAQLWEVATASASAPDTVPARSSWFKPLLLYGTSFDFENRDPKSMSVEHLESLSKLSPYDLRLLVWVAWRKYGEHPTSENLISVYGSIADYSAKTSRAIANAVENDPAKKLANFEKAASLDPSCYFDLGDLYVSDNQPEKASDAYAKAIDNCSDSVMMANKCKWLVMYLFDHGKKDKALKIASDAAEVYSNGGLKTMAGLQERMGNLKAAAEWYQKANERYEDPLGLCAFYLRHRDNAKYETEAQKYMKTKMPDGLEKAELDSFKEPPKDGCKINSRSALTEKYGVNKGDVIVAADGYRVRGSEQYSLIREMNLSPDTINLVIWDGKSYRKLKAILPDKKFNCDLANFKG